MLRKTPHKRFLFGYLQNNKNEDNSRMLALQDENGNLKKRVQTLEYEVQNASKLHLNTKNQLEDELLGLRKKLRDAEARYTNLAATPPKVSFKLRNLL